MDRYNHRFLFIGALIEILEGLITIFTLTLYKPYSTVIVTSKEFPSGSNSKYLKQKRLLRKNYKHSLRFKLRQEIK